MPKKNFVAKKSLNLDPTWLSAGIFLPFLSDIKCFINRAEIQAQEQSKEDSYSVEQESIVKSKLKQINILAFKILNAYFSRAHFKIPYSLSFENYFTDSLQT